MNQMVQKRLQLLKMAAHKPSSLKEVKLLYFRWRFFKPLPLWQARNVLFPVRNKASEAKWAKLSLWAKRLAKVVVVVVVWLKLLHICHCFSSYIDDKELKIISGCAVFRTGAEESLPKVCSGGTLTPKAGQSPFRPQYYSFGSRQCPAIMFGKMDGSWNDCWKMHFFRLGFRWKFCPMPAASARPPRAVWAAVWLPLGQLDQVDSERKILLSLFHFRSLSLSRRTQNAS